LHLPDLKCQNHSYLPCPNPLLAYDTLAMLTSTQMVPLL
jgi:hypothetical protein